jgi:hypothetical protein
MLGPGMAGVNGETSFGLFGRRYGVVLLDVFELVLIDVIEGLEAYVGF